MRLHDDDPVWKVLATVLALCITAAILALWVESAEAQPAAADHGTGTDAECARWGCLYGHDRGHWTRDGYQERTAYGIAYERLPDGPDGRYYLGVQWPGVYDPERRAMWDSVARCESTWRWDYNGSSGYDGGLQFSPSTWRAYGGGEYAGAAWGASPEEQIDVAERVLWQGYGPHGPQGRGAWPHCGRGLVRP